MHVEKQGEAECSLATVAALAGIPLIDVRKTACSLAGVSHWSEVVGKRVNGVYLFFDVMAKLCRLYGKGSRSLGVHMMHNRVPITSIYGETLPHDLGKKIRTLPPKGRGIVRVCQPGKKVGHIAPWEDGLVYDPNHPKKPMTLKAFRMKYGNVKRITIER